MNLDHPDVEDDRKAFEKHLDELGMANVVAMLAAGQFLTTNIVVVQEWLKAQTRGKEKAK